MIQYWTAGSQSQRLLSPIQLRASLLKVALNLCRVSGNFHR